MVIQKGLKNVLVGGLFIAVLFFGIQLTSVNAACEQYKNRMYWGQTYTNNFDSGCRTHSYNFWLDAGYTIQLEVTANPGGEVPSLSLQNSSGGEYMYARPLLFNNTIVYYLPAGWYRVVVNREETNFGSGMNYNLKITNVSANRLYWGNTLSRSGSNTHVFWLDRNYTVTIDVCGIMQYPPNLFYHNQPEANAFRQNGNCYRYTGYLPGGARSWYRVLVYGPAGSYTIKISQG